MPRLIDRHRLMSLVEAGAQLVEVLPSEEYLEEHLPGAISMPLRQVDRQADGLLARDRAVIVYCADLY